MREAATLAVVGAGPRGTAVLERIAASAPQLARGRRVHVHLVDPYPPGGGYVWQTAQSPHLLMNTLAAHATMFTDDTVACDGPVATGPNLYEWAVLLREGRLDEHVPPSASAASDRPRWAAPPEVLAEAADLQPWSHPTRRFESHYLAWVFTTVRSRLPDGMRLTVHPRRAVGLCDLAGGRQALWLEGAAAPLVVDAAVLALGHTAPELTAEGQALAEFAQAHGAVYLPPGNPLDARLEAIPPAARVLVRGLGMNFFDHMILLTAGRGGRFTREAGGRLRYRPSGREPVLTAGSRRGVPYRAKPVFGSLPPATPPRYFTDAAARRLRAAAPVDFDREVWPLIAKDAALVYYLTLARSPGGGGIDAGTVTAAFDGHPWGSAALRVQLDAALPAGTARLDVGALDRPLAGRAFPDGRALTRWVQAWLRGDLDEARQGHDSALKLATTALGAARNRVRDLAADGGVRGSSHRGGLRWFRSLAASLASGPPAVRSEALLALTEAGVVEFAGPDLRVTVDPDRGVFVGRSAAVGGEVTARALIDAHLPDPDLRRTADPLLRALRDRGAVRPYATPDPDGDVPSGGLDVTPGTFRLIDRNGQPHPARFAVGIPTEPVHWLTAIGAQPRTNAALLRHADAVARAALDTAVSAADARQTAAARPPSAPRPAADQGPRGRAQR